MSSRLLIDEYPVMVLPSLAKRFGVSQAIVLQQVHFWLTNQKIGKEVDGRRWFYNSATEWQTNFPWWTARYCAKILAELREMGILLARGDLNEWKIDNTLWWSIDYDRLQEVLGGAGTVGPAVGTVVPDNTIVTTETTSLLGNSGNYRRISFLPGEGSERAAALPPVKTKTPPVAATPPLRIR